MTLLVTGAAGFLGRNLVAALIQSGERVVAFGRADRRPSPSPGVTWVNADLNMFDHWETLLEDVSTVYHLAWSSLPHSANADPSRDASTNILTTLRLLEGLRSRPGVRFVFPSSGGTVYGRLDVVPVSEEHPTKPLTAYGISKLTVENYLNFFGDAHGLDPVSLRISNLFGPGQAFGRGFGAIATLSAFAFRGEPIRIYGDGETVRDYIFVTDVVAALLKAGRSSATSRVLNIGTGEGRSLNDIVNIVARYVDYPLKVNYEAPRPFDIPVSVLKIDRARNELGWAPIVPFDEGAAQTILDVRSRL
jgi:UDP-glucose 4-epimerase